MIVGTSFQPLLPSTYCQNDPYPSASPPQAEGGALGWVSRNLFPNWRQSLLSILLFAFLAVMVWQLSRFLVLDAVWFGDNGEACRSQSGGRVGACWAFIADRFPYFIYGSYPTDQRWRVNVVFLAGAICFAYLLWPRAPFKRLGIVTVITVLPLTGFVLLSGWEAAGLRHIPTNLWGGLTVTVVVAIVGISTALPIGILLALGRRSQLPIVRWFSIGLIELPRGVPLVTVLFMANTMLPLFLPPDLNPDKLVRALVGITFFAAAYLAEIVRGGLQAVPRGQNEAASALGFGYWKTTWFITLPQALKVAVPNIVSINIGLFKDTSLLLIVGIFDFLSTIETARIDPKWAAPTISTTGYAFAALFYFTFCFCMSRYGALIERRLSRDRER
ncbi:amino acid ABC transporter permease [Rhizobium sp. CNPSo 3968]|uniref:amino acid ABC transporter permease n=1 Tax=Rhizobium sp. CNPSo 3968 TaxID=3021408 RepID=UPI0025514066|nr:amino acid ABC transporter permease [Rhizobium sp. CNPSo 3968]MDK4717892.1 amino acid ABC transporter permease [Rhizobium sp. CNPSo 3968]